MTLSIIVILIIGLTAYLHYVQGLLSGLISAVLALLATGIAMGYYEPMAEWLSGGKRNDQSQGYCLIGLFTLTYLVGRILFDKFIPGNVRMPFIADKVGAVLCGVVTGMCGAGVIAIAIQSMPLGISEAGHAR